MSDLNLGALLDSAAQRSDRPAALPASELTTHGVIVGMTGSGKTGLAVVLIEECLRQGIPTLLIDPKGDLTNLCLTFPSLAPEEFRPWVDEGEATKAGQSADEFAAAQAGAWRDGLGQWGLAAGDIAGLREKVDFTIYTPGSSSGVPLNTVGTLKAPVGVDAETLSDEIDSYVTSLLALVGIDADPLSSREHILLSNLVNYAWSAGQDLDLGMLLAQVQQPPMRKLGFLELDTFFPPAERMQFALRLNGLLAAPGFQSWLLGEPIDIDAMLTTTDGKPRCAIVTTAHLSDSERQSVTALILAKTITWMRRKGGTTDLRALLYMDEVAGYLPPTANPPTKKPILLLMKQARAFGLGVVLATQNPVDVDYKALSNAGTWLIGRLQTEQDKSRIMDGLASATGGVDLKAVSASISSLGKRQFVLRRAGKDAPEVMTSRWAMSYLRGPLTKQQITTLRDSRFGAGVRVASTVSPTTATEMPEGAPAESGRGEEANNGSGTGTAPTATADTQPAAEVPAAKSPPVVSAPPATTNTSAPIAADDETPVMPKLAAGLPVSFLDLSAPWAAEVGAKPGQHLRLGAVARVYLRYKDARAGILEDEEFEAVLFPLPQTADASGFMAVDYDDRDLTDLAPQGALFGMPTAEVSSKTWWNDLKRSLLDWLVRTQTEEILVNADLKLFSRIGESEQAFVARCEEAAVTASAAAIEAMRSKYATRLDGVRRKAADARFDAERARQAYDLEFSTLNTVGTVLGGLLSGRRSRTVMMSQAKRQSAANAKVGSLAAKADQAGHTVADLEAQLSTELAELDIAWKAKAAAFTRRKVPLAKSNISVADFRPVWIPVG